MPFFTFALTGGCKFKKWNITEETKLLKCTIRNNYQLLLQLQRENNIDMRQVHENPNKLLNKTRDIFIEKLS